MKTHTSAHVVDSPDLLQDKLVAEQRKWQVED